MTCKSLIAHSSSLLDFYDSQVIDHSGHHLLYFNAQLYHAQHLSLAAHEINFKLIGMSSESFIIRFPKPPKLYLSPSAMCLHSNCQEFPSFGEYSGCSTPLCLHACCSLTLECQGLAFLYLVNCYSVFKAQLNTTASYHVFSISQGELFFPLSYARNICPFIYFQIIYFSEIVKIIKNIFMRSREQQLSQANTQMLRR